MSGLCTLALSLWECAGVRTASDIASVFAELSQAGLRPARGAWTVQGGSPEPVTVAELPRFVSESHFQTPAFDRLACGAPVSLSSSLQEWRCPLVHQQQPHVPSTLVVDERPGGRHDVLISVLTSRVDVAGLSLEDFVDTWVPLLERLGGSLNERTQPAIGVLLNSLDPLGEFPLAVAKRRLDSSSAGGRGMDRPMSTLLAADSCSGSRIAQLRWRSRCTIR